MTRRLILALCCCGLALALSAQTESRPSSREVRAAVRAVVEDQLAALQREDFAGAYRHAALGLRRQFRADVFEAMIRRGYPALVGHTARELGIVREVREGRAFVDVVVRDARHRPSRFRYQTVREENEWRVEGVIALPAAPRGDT